MVLTSSYGANVSRVVVGSTSMRMRSSTVTPAPMRPSSAIIVVTSFRWGTLPIDTGPSASSAAARIGSVAFLAPEMRTSPSSGTPPRICSLSKRRSGRQCERVAAAPCHSAGVYAWIESAWISRPMRGPSVAVDELVPLQAALALERGGDDHGREMRVVVAFHADLRVGQAGLDQARHLLGVIGGLPGDAEHDSSAAPVIVAGNVEVAGRYHSGRPAGACLDDRPHR